MNDTAAAMPAISRQIWDMKYRLKNPDGSPVDATVEDTWRRVARALAAAGAAPDALAKLVDRRLLRIEERLDMRRVELTHDVLCGVVKSSRDPRCAPRRCGCGPAISVADSRMSLLIKPSDPVSCTPRTV